jgi:hypothetical protein
MTAHKFETFEPENVNRPGEWCKHCNTTRDEVPGLHLFEDGAGLTWQEFSSELFECEYCHECFGDAEDHIPCIGPFGLWFAMCKFQPFTNDWALRNGQLQAIA